MRRACLLLMLCLTSATHAQWQLQDSHTPADLRGIDNVGNGVAWASGNHGSVLRTLDGGTTWQRCATPPDADALDFRGVQTFDKDTAVVMSSGKGDLSRLYKTIDGCKTWRLLFTNPDKDGFWDAVKFVDRDHGYLLGDPVKQEGDVAEAIVMKETVDGGRHWREWRERPGFLQPKNHLFIFAASNSSMVADQHAVMFGAGGNSQAGLVTLAKQGIRTVVCDCPTPFAADVTNFGERAITFQWVLMATGASAGVFSVASGPNGIMLVGGDYKKPASSNGNAAFVPSGDVPRLPQNPPHGYRSAVAYDPPTNTWITVGPNGTDVSTDDGKNWRALKPSAQDDPEADQHWNALSLPFVVGPKGRIGVLRLDALKPSR